MTTTALRRIATYERVSSEDQRDRETIKTQSDALAQHLASDPTVQLVARYIDDGVPGTIPMGERPGGRSMLQAAGDRKFDELWTYNVKRLGREAVDLLILRRRFEPLGIVLTSLLEGVQTGLSYDLQAIVADNDLRQFLRVSADGMNRAAREGRYTGGIVPLGYEVVGRKQTARLVPSEKLIWGDWTEAGLVRWIYERMAIDGWSCPRVARQLNSLGVPTAYSKDGRLVRRGQRKERTQGCWHPGRILAMVNNPVYKGDLQYGRRSTKPDGREVISAPVPALVSGEVWQAAQETLASNRIVAKNTERVYLLRSVIRCGGCGKTYVAARGRGFPWYRCNGRMMDRRPVEERCQGKALRGPDIEGIVWHDIERFLRDPGNLLQELAMEREEDGAAAAAEAERMTLESALAALQQRRKRAIDLNLRECISDAELDDLLTNMIGEQKGVESRLLKLQGALVEPQEPPDQDRLEQLRKRLDAGLDDIQRQEIAGLLVKRIIVHTEVVDSGKSARVVIEYRFPGVVNDITGRGSWLPPA